MIGHGITMFLIIIKQNFVFNAFLEIDIVIKWNLIAKKSNISITITIGHPKFF